MIRIVDIVVWLLWLLERLLWLCFCDCLRVVRCQFIVDCSLQWWRACSYVLGAVVGVVPAVMAVANVAVV